MTSPDRNASDPVLDPEHPRIGPAEADLPEPPDHEDFVYDVDQPEPEQVPEQDEVA